MIKTEQKIYIYETEIKPNRYSLLVLLFALCSCLCCWILNELGIFRVGKWEMRVGSLISVISVIVPLILLYSKTMKLSNPCFKFIILASATVLTLSTTTLMTFHTTIMLLFPVFLAMLYRSELLGKMAVLSSMFCTIVSPLLSYVIGSWDIEFFKELILIGTNEAVTVVGDKVGVNIEGIMKILLYIVLPRCMMVGMLAMLLLFVIRLSAAHINNQMVLYRVRHLDNLTGLFNQNYYKEILASKKPDIPVGVLFFDVNSLKATNDKYGHEIGDLLLQLCAKSLLDICDDHTHAFRIGGDEYLVVVENATEQELVDKLRLWNLSMEAINADNALRYRDYDGLHCSMAPGYAFGSYSDLSDLISQADDQMYRNKAEYKRAL